MPGNKCHYDTVVDSRPKFTVAAAVLVNKDALKMQNCVKKREKTLARAGEHV
jgi:hypothetical protein